MLTEEDIENLPDDPDVALAVIADLLAQESGPAMQNDAFTIHDANAWYADIQAHLIAHDLTERYPKLDCGTPAGDPSTFWEWWHRYAADLRQYRTLIYMTRKRNGSTVVLPPARKADIHALLNQIREIVERLNLSETKRNMIYRLIAKLQSEVDQSRTGVQTVLNMVLEASRVAKEVGENAKPLVDRVKELFGIFADAESGSTGPAVGHDDIPKIENKNARPKARGSRAELDDDIPF